MNIYFASINCVTDTVDCLVKTHSKSLLAFSTLECPWRYSFHYLFRLYQSGISARDFDSEVTQVGRSSGQAVAKRETRIHN